MRRTARGSGATVMLLISSEGGSGLDEARRYSTTASGRTSARMNKRTSSCRSMHWLDWVAASEGGLTIIQVRSISWETYDEGR